MHISRIKNSKYLSKEDCGPGILVTIESLAQEDLAMEGQPAEMKWVMQFAEPESKPFVLNTTNAVLIAAALGSEETDEWIGRKIVLFSDPTVMMHGKAIGGIRARAPKNQPKQAAKSPVADVPSPKPKPEPIPYEAPEDDVPF
jgi:hypothetical protein